MRSRDTGCFCLFLLPLSTQNFQILFQNDCSSSSNHVHIPATKTIKRREWRIFPLRPLNGVYISFNFIPQCPNIFSFYSQLQGRLKNVSFMKRKKKELKLIGLITIRMKEKQILGDSQQFLIQKFKSRGISHIFCIMTINFAFQITLKSPSC